MFSFAFYPERAGGHTHVAVFAGETGKTRGKCGDLCFRREEWEEFSHALRDARGSMRAEIVIMKRLAEGWVIPKENDGAEMRPVEK